MKHRLADEPETTQSPLSPRPSVQTAACALRQLRCSYVFLCRHATSSAVRSTCSAAIRLVPPPA